MSYRRQDSDEIDRVTDRSLNTPEEFAPHLEVLSLTNTEVSDVTMRYLARNMPNLRLIDVRGSRVTEPGVIRLKTGFPSLQVVCDFPEWSVDPALISSDWWIDRNFHFQDNIKRPSTVTTRAQNLPLNRHERIEIIDVGPGMVRLRRIVDRPVLFPIPVPNEPAEVVPEQGPAPEPEAPPGPEQEPGQEPGPLESPPPLLPRPEDQELPRSPSVESLRSSSSASSTPPPLDNLPDPSA